MSTKKNNDKRSLKIWPFTLVIGIVFLFIGINDGQLEDIYKKAVMICLECIGIG
ncbi:MAG: hypothetical protein IJA34_07205 [Lachnospiraceae bacterium]|nr:hypothetical protein [Lachnospiraceae bacterium]